jgi:hypothetical protein
MSETLETRGRGSARDMSAGLHARLAHWNHRRFALQTPRADWRTALEADHTMRLAEVAFLERARKAQARRAAAAPRDPDGFVAWFENLKETGPGQGDALFPWLAERASLEEMRWFVEQEAAGEAGFEDLVAMAQVKAPTAAKLELARNYWDEMGRGKEKGMHGPMLAELVTAMDVTPAIETTVPQSLALGNVMAGLASNRMYAYHIIGALGAIELTAPTRACYVAAGLRRLGIDGRARHYFELHAVLDVKHSEEWNKEVFATIVEETPDVAPFIAEGALMRLQCGADCFVEYRRRLWGGDGSTPPA